MWYDSDGSCVASLLFFTGAFSLGLGPVPTLLVTELFPSRLRASALAAASVVFWGLNVGVAFGYPYLVGSVIASLPLKLKH